MDGVSGAETQTEWNEDRRVPAAEDGGGPESPRERGADIARPTQKSASLGQQ